MRRGGLGDGWAGPSREPICAYHVCAEQVWGPKVDQQLQNVRVLLVEDDPIIALDMTYMLEAAGAIVIGPAHNVASAIALLQSNNFDVAVLDHLIVGGNSLPVADELARRRSQFLFHTSHRGDLSRIYPQIQVIDKPSRPGELVAALAALVRSDPQVD